MTEECAELSTDGADRGEGYGLRKVVRLGGELWVNDALGGNLCGGDATWYSNDGQTGISEGAR